MYNKCNMGANMVMKVYKGCKKNVYKGYKLRFTMGSRTAKPETTAILVSPGNDEAEGKGCKDG